MRNKSLSKCTCSVPNFFISLLMITAALPQANPAVVYEEKAFLPASWCTSVDVSPDKSTIYARAHFGEWNEGVRLYSAKTYQHIKDFQNLPNVPWTILASSDGNYLYASHYYGGAVVKLDASTGSVVKSISVGPWPGFMLFDSARRYLYVGVNCPGTGAVGSISVIDTSTDTVAGNVALNGEPNFCQVLSPDEAFLYVGTHLRSPETLFKIRVSDRSIVNTLVMPGIVNPALSGSPDGDFLYVSDDAAGLVRIIEAGSLSETGTYSVPHVQNFSVAPSGDVALAVSYASGSSEVSLHVLGVSSGSIIQTITHTLTGSLVDAFGYVCPIVWDKETGRAHINVSAENGGVIVLSPVEEPRQVVYQTDFSTDPEWVTDQPSNYYWNQTAGTYHARVENNAPGYQPNRYFYRPVSWTGQSLELEWDIKMTRVDWSAGVSFGLFDENIAFGGFGGGQGACLEFANPDAGRLFMLYLCGAAGATGTSSPGGTYAANVWYRCKLLYDAGAGKISVEVVERDSGSAIWSAEQPVPGGFTQPLTKLGGSRSGFGETGGGYSGVDRWAVAEAEINNVMFKRAAVGPLPPVVTQLAINGGAATTESRTVTLNNTTENNATHYMASESSAFAGAAWLPYSTAPQFTLSEGDGTKTVYFKTKNEAGESNVVSDSIVLKEAVWQVVYQSDFSSDPQWVTDQPSNYYWNESPGTYHSRVENNAPAYRPNRFFYTPVSWTRDSFELEWDVEVTRMDWSGGVCFGLFDEDLALGGFEGGQGVQLVFGHADEGLVLALYATGAGGLAYADSKAGPRYSTNVWYTCRLSYDAAAGEVGVELNNRSSGSSLWSKTLSVPGGFTQPLARLGGSWSGFGETSGGYAGVNRWAIAEAEIDNVVYRGAGAVPQPPVVTQFAVNAGAESTESRTVTLNNSPTNGPTHYMASQSSDFTGASWQPYSTAPQFTLSAGDGQKTVYFKTKNDAGESNVVNDSIVLTERLWKVVYQTDLSSDPRWITNDATNLSWDSATETFHGWQANTNTSYAYAPVQLRSGASFRLEFDARINSVEWSAGLTFGLFEQRLMYNAGVAIDYSLVDAGYTTALYAGNPSLFPDWEVSNWETGAWYRNVVEYDAATRTIRFEARRRDDDTLISQLSLSNISSFPPGMAFLGASRLHMEGYNDSAVDFNIDNIILKELEERPKWPLEIIPLAGPLFRITWDSEEGYEYQLWATSDLSSREWTPVGPRMGGTGEKLYVDDYVEGVGRRFYRVEIISSAAENEKYAVVVSQSTKDAEGWQDVVGTLVAKHDAELIPYSGSPFPSTVKDALAAYHPRYVCFVGQPAEVTDEFARNVHRLTRELDDDPFGDCIWGIITGASAEDALRLASASSPLEIQRGLLKAGGFLEWLPAGVFHSEGDNGMMRIKEPGGEIDKRTDGPLDDTETLVVGLNSGQYQLFVTSGHATEYNWQLHWPDPDSEGFFYSSNGQLYAIDHNGTRHDIVNLQPLIYWAPGNCLIGRIAGANSMALGWLGSGGAMQFCGYIVPTWYGYMGWGLNDYFLKLQDRFSFAEAFFLTNQALIFDQLNGTPGTDPDGLEYDRDAVVFYGDPALRAVVTRSRAPLYDQTLDVEEIPGTPRHRISLTITMRQEAEVPRPVIAFLPFRIVASDAQIEQTTAKAVEISDDMILAQIWIQGDPPLPATHQTTVTFTCLKSS